MNALDRVHRKGEIDHREVNRLASKTNLLKLVHYLGAADLRKESFPNVYSCLCPFCHHDAFNMNTSTREWHCFKCNVGGGIFRLVEFKLGRTFKQAYRFLQRFNKTHG